MAVKAVKREGLPPPKKEGEASGDIIEKKLQDIVQEIQKAGLHSDNHWRSSLVWGVSETGKIHPTNFSGPDGPPNYPRTSDLGCEISLCTSGNVGEVSTGLTYSDKTPEMRPVHREANVTVRSDKKMPIKEFIEFINDIVEKLNKAE